MPIAALSSIRHGYGTNIVLDGATVGIEAGEKVGLVGRNGGGKSTLMKILAGLYTPDAGSVQVQRGTRIGYLSQDPQLDPADTLRHAAARAFAELDRLHREMEAVYERMATAQGAELDQLMKRQARLEEEMERAGGYAIDHRIDEMLHGLGFTDDQFDLKVTAMSGGQRARVGLARLLLEQPDLLLLDEPTNHLDIEGRRWLEHFLADEYPGAVLLVSHDRRLLDYVVNRIVEVDQGRVLEYPGNYADFIALRRERLLNSQRVYDKQQDKVRAEQQYIMRYKAGQRAKQARGRQTRLERFQRDEVVERPMELDAMKLELPRAPRVGDHVLRAAGLSKRYGDKVLFEGLDVAIAPGDRIGIVGPNGAGKTTLVRALLGEIAADAGEVKVSPQISVGYFKQTQDHIDRTLTVWQYLQRVIASNEGALRASEQQARNLAGAFLFSGEEQEKCVGNLSGGERARMVIAGLVSAAHNLIVLDEPTNHLDIPSAERLEGALEMVEDGGYEGALILISHDRALLEACCSTFIILDGHGGARVFEGTWSEWEAREAEERAAAARAPARGKAAPPPSAAPRPGATAKNPPRAPSRAAPTGSRHGPAAAKPGGGKGSRPIEQWSTEDLERRITAIETRTREIDAQLLDPKVYSDAARSRTLAEERGRIQAELEPLEFEWSRRGDGADGA
jgi:ATP-binding cassette subfamily F protein 3